MDIGVRFYYDVVFHDDEGAERGLDNVTFFAPVIHGDLIAWHSCELAVIRVQHFVDGQRPTILAKINN